MASATLQRFPGLADQALDRACRRHHVARLDLFGSALDDRFDPGRSDVDLLVSFDALALADFAANWWSLHAELERLFARKVELVEDSSLENPYLRARIMATRHPLYPAP